MTIRNLPGQKFGRWTVVERAKKNHALCRCECGEVRVVSIGNLRNGASRSCGCQREGYTSDKPQTLKMRAWRVANPEKARRQVERQTAIRTPVRFTGTELWGLYEIQCGLCAYCLDPLEGKFETDHIVPLSSGGANTIDNVVCACKRCNQAKGNLSLLHFVMRGGAQCPPRKAA